MKGRKIKIWASDSLSHTDHVIHKYASRTTCLSHTTAKGIQSIKRKVFLATLMRSKMKVLNQILTWCKVEQLYRNNADLHHLMIGPPGHSLEKYHATSLYPQEC